MQQKGKSVLKPDSLVYVVYVFKRVQREVHAPIYHEMSSVFAFF